MKIVILVAMDKEFGQLKGLLDGAKAEEHSHYVFVKGTMGKHEVTLMKCGIGKVNAAVGATVAIEAYRPDLVVSSGCAGGADTTLHVADCVVASACAYHDVYCGPESTLGAVQGLPLYYEPGENITESIAPQPHIHFGLICSGDQFIDTAEQLTKIKAAFPQAKAVDMESAAIAQTCYLYNTDFISIRVISDSPGAGHDNAQQYSDFWAEAPEHTFAVVNKLIQSI